MKIGLLTFHYCFNQGAVLQAYGLFKCLSQYAEVEFIDYRLPILEDRYSVIKCAKKSLRNSRGCKNKIRAFVSDLIFSISRALLFNRFINKYLRSSGSSDTENYNHIFIGSDQVWNGSITGGYHNYYWGYFPHIKEQHIHSYAASCIANQDLANKEDVIKRLSVFDNISVREQEVHDLLESYKISNTLVLDPVFLLSKEEWLKLTYNISEKYVYEYNILGVKTSKAILGKIKQNLGVVCEKNMIYNNKKVCFSPTHFLSVIRNAEYVVTSSFHGLAFSIIFERPFVVVKSNTSKDNRLLSLLSLIGCEERAISDISELDNLSPIKWQVVRDRLSAAREESLIFISKCIG